MSARILVVDDLETNIKLLEVKLTNQYYEVFTARNGLEALEVLGREKIDIILLDVMMPQMDGFETCRRIKANPKTAYIPVIMVTALSDVENRVNGLNAGADDFITKPIVDVALLARIRSYDRLKSLIDEIRDKGEDGVQFIENRNDSNLITGATILLLDDDIAQCNFIKNTLNEANIIEVDLKKNIDTYLNANIDLVIVSTQLINIDGLRICVKILNNKITRNIPIIVLIEEADSDIIVKALDLGVSDYIISPLNKEEVRVRVKTQISRKNFQDALKNNLLNNITLAKIDSLTGLYNRYYFNTKAKEFYNLATTSDTPLSLIMIDLDYFKQVNDNYGHLVGDELLKQVSLRLKKSIRGDDILARFGGEEFIFLLPNTNLNQAYIIAERIRQNIEATPYKIQLEINPLINTISLGVSTLKKGDTIEDLINRADKALYVAKQQGRNKVVKEEE